MEKIELTKEESEVYIKIVEAGDMDAMFDFGVAVGKSRLLEKQIENIKNLKIKFFK